MNEDLFHWPGRYRLWREGGVLQISITTSEGGRARTHIHRLRPREGYAFLMARRRTELLYAIAQAVAAKRGVESDFDFGRLVESCALADETELCALADEWNKGGRVAEALAELLPWPGGCGNRPWLRPVRRVTRKEVQC